MAVRRCLFRQSTRSAKKGAQDACVGKNPTDRGKQGVKKSLLTEGDGGPLGIVITAANVHDSQVLAATLEAIVVEVAVFCEEEKPNLCLDKAYDNPTCETVVEQAGYLPHIRRIGEEKLDADGEKTHPARRWVVERTWAWLSRWRGILIRWEKKADNYLAILKLACALLWFRRWRKLADYF